MDAGKMSDRMDIHGGIDSLRPEEAVIMRDFLKKLLEHHEQFEACLEEYRQQGHAIPDTLQEDHLREVEEMKQEVISLIRSQAQKQEQADRAS